MTSIFRHILFFILQVTGAWIVVVGGMIIYILHANGMAYAGTPSFGEDVRNYARIGLAVAAIFSLILFCYHLTHKSFDASTDVIDSNRWDS